MTNATIYVKTNELYHYGMPRRSGRYKWGSGDRPYQSLGYKARSKEERKAMTKEEKYRAQSVDEADRKYGTVSDYYQKAVNRYTDKANKLDAKYYRTIDRGYDKIFSKYKDVNDPKSKEKSLKLEAKGDKIAGKARKYYDKAAVAQIGKDMCDALLEQDLAKISVMDTAADKKARGKAVAKQVMAEVGVALAMNAALIPTAGVAVIPIGGKTNYNRLSKEDISKAYATVKADNQDYLSDKQMKELQRAAARTTGTNTTWLKNNNKSVSNPDADEVDVKRGSVSTTESKYKDNTNNTKREWYTKEQQASKLKTAKENDNYDLYFLEAIQNTQMMYNNDKKAIDTAYEKYLRDPDDFFMNRANKYKE